MSVAISSINLAKNFKTYEKNPGIWNSLKSLFHRDYKINSAIQDFNFEIKKGELVALLGPNGAGKTTLMKMMTGIIVPSAGKLSVLGFDPWERDKEFRKKIALVMGQKSQLWWDIPAMDSLLLLQKYYEISDMEFKRRMDELTTLLDVGSKLHIHVRKLSLGERMKLELMACLLHSPDIIFLDEPTIGLDLMAQENIRKFLLDYHRKHSCTMIITSHYMADVEALCQRLVLVMQGRKAFDGPLAEFTQLLGDTREMTFIFDKPISAQEKTFKDYDAVWSPDNQKVDLLVPFPKMRDLTSQILRDFPVTEFSTEKTPIERAMKTFMKNNTHSLQNQFATLNK